MVLVKYGIAALLAFGPLAAFAQNTPTTGGVSGEIPEDENDCEDEQDAAVEDEQNGLCGGLAVIPLGATAAGAIPLFLDATGGGAAVGGILGAAASGTSTTSTTSTVSTVNPQ